MRERFLLFLDFTRRNPVIVASLTVILLMGSASYYLWHQQHELSTSHDEVLRTGQDMQQSLTASARIAAEMATVTEALDFIDRNLVDEGDRPGNLGYFYTTIEPAARIRFSQINQLSSQPQPPDAQFKTVPFSLRATGPYRSIMRLLHEMEAGPRQLRIRTYAMTQAEGDPDTVTLELNVDLLARP